MLLTGSSSDQTQSRELGSFTRKLGELGWAEGKSLAVEARWAADSEALPNLATELVRSGVDVILSPGPAATMAATKATATVPIVMIGSTDPRTMGAAGLARPGGNLTGLTVGLPEMMAGKRLELLTEALPGIRTVAVLWDVKRAADSPAASELAAAARALKVQLQHVEVAGVGDYERAFASAKRSAAGGVLLVDSPRSVVNRALIAELALKHRLALTSVFSRLVEAGALLSYGPELSDLFDRAASYVDKILRGAKPGDLPIEQPTKFELAINLKTAKALGVSLPPSLVARADRVIE
jgi:putative ABC transport system substrate-binding protein